MPDPTHPADTLKSLFRDIFQCRGRDFGSPSRGVLGISDGNEGVQWNAGYYPRDGAVWLGVNLEGMKYDDWPVARLVERKISLPLLLTRYRPQVARPDKVEMDVSPHLKFRSPLVGITSRAMREGRADLKALYEFVVRKSFERRDDSRFRVGGRIVSPNRLSFIRHHRNSTSEDRNV